MTHTQKNTINRMGGFVTGLVVGGLAGAGTMLLLAPQSGEKTRAQIQQQSGAMRDQMGKTVEGALAQARGQSRQINTNIHEQVGNRQ